MRADATIILIFIAAENETRSEVSWGASQGLTSVLSFSLESINAHPKLYLWLFWGLIMKISDMGKLSFQPLLLKK